VACVHRGVEIDCAPEGNDQVTDPPATPASKGRAQFLKESLYTPPPRPAPETPPTAVLVLSAVLDQFGHNFLLNDLGVDLTSGRMGERIYSESLSVPGHEPRRRESPVERVHQARVSVRRLRSTVRTFAGLLDDEWTASISSALSWYGGILGVARDLDVLRAAIAKSVWLVDDDALRSLLLGFIDTTIADAVVQGNEERSTLRYRRLVDDIASVAVGARFKDGASGGAREVLLPELRTTWHDARRAYRDALQRTTDRKLHRLRISLKRLQYASETIGIVEGKPAVRLAHSAEALQTKLGAVHDAVGAVEWLEGLIEFDARLAKPLRDLIEYHRNARREARRGWRDDFKRVERSWARLHDAADDD